MPRPTLGDPLTCPAPANVTAPQHGSLTAGLTSPFRLALLGRASNSDPLEAQRRAHSVQASAALLQLALGLAGQGAPAWAALVGSWFAATVAVNQGAPRGALSV